MNASAMESKQSKQKILMVMGVHMVLRVALLGVVFGLPTFGTDGNIPRKTVAQMENYDGLRDIVEVNGQYFVPTDFHPGIAGRLIGTLPERCTYLDHMTVSVRIDRYVRGLGYQVRCKA